MRGGGGGGWLEVKSAKMLERCAVGVQIVPFIEHPPPPCFDSGHDEA